MNTFINILQLIGGIILSIGYIPQIKKVSETKSMKDFSFNYLAMLAIGVGLMEIYAIYNVIQGVAIMFMITNTVAFLLALTMLGLYGIYGRK